MGDQYSTPVWIEQDGKEFALDRIPVSGPDSTYNEAFIQDLAFRHPSALPINEIDRAYEGLIPVCRELSTPAGPLDVLYVTPKGRLVVVEAKLWRNPEARRKVVGQILDYAKELARWDYVDLQREISRATKRKGNVLYEIVAERHPETNEASFVDAVTRNLRHGRMLLLILGDGIREGVGAIAEFLEDAGSLEFTFGLVELVLYRTPAMGMLVQPRVLAKTVIFKRSVVLLGDERLVMSDAKEESEEPDELSESEQFYLAFWPELLNELSLDDASQPLPRSVGKKGCIYFPMPPSGAQSWLTVYFSKKNQDAGVFLTFARGGLADMLYEQLYAEQDAINIELGLPVIWASSEAKHSVTASQKFPDLYASGNRDAIKAFFKDSINTFVNVFRRRLARILEEDAEL